MYIERVPNRNSPPAVLLRESYREGGRVKKRTLANLSHLSDATIEGLRRVLRGEHLAALIEQAVVNLLDNAIKYSDSQGSITLKSHQQNSEVIISVQDHGIGIAQKHLPRLFERFYRVDTARSRQTGGTGLGLAIVKTLAQAMHGTTGMEPNQPQGAIFWVQLPAAD